VADTGAARPQLGGGRKPPASRRGAAAWRRPGPPRHPLKKNESGRLRWGLRKLGRAATRRHTPHELSCLGTPHRECLASVTPPLASATPLPRPRSVLLSTELRLHCRSSTAHRSDAAAPPSLSIMLHTHTKATLVLRWVEASHWLPLKESHALLLRAWCWRWLQIRASASAVIFCSSAEGLGGHGLPNMS